LGGAERLGPFDADGRPVFFNFWYPARRIEVIETGAAPPARPRERTPTGAGVVLLTATSAGTRAVLGAAVNAPTDTRLVLRNALVCAAGAERAFAEGALTDRHALDAGSRTLNFGVYAWAPDLPDPYVGNFQACRPDRAAPHGALTATVRWSPSAVAVAFPGELSVPRVCPHERSPGDPVRAPLSDNERAARVARAAGQNKEAQAVLDGQLAERLGRTPPLFLLDVSTNQDLLGVALWGVSRERPNPAVVAPVLPALAGAFRADELDAHSPVEALRLVTLPQVQWEPVRTLGWFPTPLASATDGGATVPGARVQKLAPVIPEPLLNRTKAAFDAGTAVTFRTTLPFGLVAVVSVRPTDGPNRRADTSALTRPDFPDALARGVAPVRRAAYRAVVRTRPSRRTGARARRAGPAGCRHARGVPAGAQRERPRHAAGRARAAPPARDGGRGRARAAPPAARGFGKRQRGARVRRAARFRRCDTESG
jgi:hypothetical protein